MSEQLITVGEAIQRLGVTSDLPANKCLTKAEFDKLVEHVPEFAPNGVYIMHKDRFLVTQDNWTYPNEEASGVAVKTDNCAFVIAKEEESSIQWGAYGTIVSGCTYTQDQNTAKTDYKGRQNTDAIVDHLGMSSTYMYAARYCKEYIFPHGVQGYLPALGELYEALQNKSEVDACMSLINGKPLYDGSINNYTKWSSTQHSPYGAFNLNWLYRTIGNTDKNKDDDYIWVRPFAAF